MRSRSLLWSFNYAIEGIVYALRTQRNMRLHALAASAVLLLALALGLGRLELVAVLLTISLVFAAELANTAIESAIDVATETFDPMGKVAKDVAAGAVLVASVNAVAVGYVLFYPRLTPKAVIAIRFIESADAHLTVIALALTSLAVLAAKAFNRERNFLRGGWPSGHTALAVAAATAIGYGTRSGPALVVGLFIAALVAQSRVEAEVHTIPQVVTGALLGFLITTAVFQISLW
ncbi:MAG: diacylglycerol kinase [Coriobacteriia bacterium]|nr:diacylglycerol kinase [Coriobacteriia bacterium]